MNTVVTSREAILLHVLIIDPDVRSNAFNEQLAPRSIYQPNLSDCNLHATTESEELPSTATNS